MQIDAVYFLAVFFVLIFFFADMIDIIKKTSGECDQVEGDLSVRYLGSSTGDEDGSLDSLCSLSQPQSYLAMYFVMVRMICRFICIIVRCSYAFFVSRVRLVD